jgi:hypothetical protein
MKTKAKTQKEAVLMLFKEGGKVSPLSCFKATGCMRLGAVVYDLKKRGYKFKIEREKFKTRFGTHGFITYYQLTNKKHNG